MSSFKRKGKGLKHFIKNLKYGYVTVGIHKKEGSHDKSDDLVANIAARHEYGVGVPERSFMRSTLFDTRRYNQKLLRTFAKQQFENKRFNKNMRKLGEELRGKIQAKIVSIRSPSNSAATIARKKGVDNPLIDTGQMRQSVHSVFHSKKPRKS